MSVTAVKRRATSVTYALDLATVGATVVGPAGPSLMDIGVKDGISAMLVTPGSLPEAKRTLDATGKMVLPGGVDPHVHTNAPDGMAGVLGRDIITKAALHGGRLPSSTLFGRARVLRRPSCTGLVDEWENTAYTDYGFHVVLSDGSPDSGIEEIPAMPEAGLPSYNTFTTTITPPGNRIGAGTSTGTLMEIMKLTAEHGGIVDILAEDDDLVMHQ